MRSEFKLACGLILNLGVAGAHAATLYDGVVSNGPLLSPDQVSIGFAAGTGTGLARVQVLGHASLDGVNGWYTDIFSLALNGTRIFSGSFDLGGGGRNQVFLQPAGSIVRAASNGMWRGGLLDLEIPLAFTAGDQLLSFRYDGSAQGRRDESWQVGRVTVTGAAAGAVPEPAAWAMLITGFGLVGATLRSRRQGSIHPVQA